MAKKTVRHIEHIPLNCKFRSGDWVSTPDGEGTIYWIVEQRDRTIIWVQFGEQWSLVDYAPEQLAIASKVKQLSLWEASDAAA